MSGRVPPGMEDCTILFKECKKGHGWLTAENWVQHGCLHCRIKELERDVRLAWDNTRLIDKYRMAAEAELARLKKEHGT